MVKKLDDDLNRYYGDKRKVSDDGGYAEPGWQDSWGGSSSSNVTSITGKKASTLWGNEEPYQTDSKGKAYTGRCAHSHPALPLPGTDKMVYGGAASSPIFDDGDGYVGLDGGMSYSERSYPWKKGVEFLFKIPDGGVPPKPEEFVKLITWIKLQVDAGKKIHVGCIGGHGRTGMVLAALVSQYGEADATSYVRKHYCEKAVETSEQVDYLFKHFGVAKVQGSRSIRADKWDAEAKVSKGTSPKLLMKSPKGKPKGWDKITPIKGNGSIW